jgi:hypothetical protein
VTSRLPLHALANSTRWAPTPKTRALKLTVGRFVISVVYAVVLCLFTARHLMHHPHRLWPVLTSGRSRSVTQQTHKHTYSGWRIPTSEYTPSRHSGE